MREIEQKLVKNYTKHFRIRHKRTLALLKGQKGLLQKVVAAHLSLDKSAYSKLEKDLREVKVSELQKLSSLFEMSIDDIVYFEGDIPKEVTIEDKAANEQLKLISLLDDDDKQTIFKLIDKMPARMNPFRRVCPTNHPIAIRSGGLTNKKFKTFFQENIGS